MQVTLLKGKIHGATVTGANVEYTGSIKIDAALLEAAGIVAHEKVLVGDLTNGARFETYVIEDERGSGVVEVNGAAAHLAREGDKVIIIAFAQLTEDEARAWKPKVVFVDEENKIKN